MNVFHQEVIKILADHSPVWVVGGAVRDKLLGRDANDIDLVCAIDTENLENILRDKGLSPQKIGTRFKTISVFGEGNRVDINQAEDLRSDAQHRDFTINAIYFNPFTNEIFDPFDGVKDLEEKSLRACGSPENRFREDPVRILRMVKFAHKYQMKISENTYDEAKDQIALLVSVSRERVTAELAEILVLESAEEAVRMLEDLGYWDVFIPELARLKGIVQNQYHSLDVWEHTLGVFRSTPKDLFLRLAGLFHDIGKWEVASRECYLSGKLYMEDNTYTILDFKIIGTRGPRELEYKLKPHLGKDIKILGARLDHYPEVVQLKRVLIGEKGSRGIVAVENGKRHFLNHERESAKLLADILKRYSFSMYFDGEGKKRELELLKLVESHMKATLTFMSEFRGEPSRRSFRDRAAELAWETCYDGREFDLQRIHDFVVLWKADFEAGKVHSEEQNQLFERIFNELIQIALWQKENLPNMKWDIFSDYVSSKGLKGQSIGKFKDFVMKKAMVGMQREINQNFLQKAYNDFTK